MLAQHHASPVALSADGGGERYEPVASVYDGLAGDDPWINELLHFADCIETGTEPISSSRDNVSTMKAVYGATSPLVLAATSRSQSSEP